MRLPSFHPLVVANGYLLKVNINLNISAKPLNILECIEWVMSQESGGIDVFIGTVRDATKGKAVVRMEFEAYEPMALNQKQKIAEEAVRKWRVNKILIHHRTGVLQPGEVPVIIAVAAAHRGAAFDACRFAIDTLKENVPIWKKEIFEDGETWVAAHP